MASNGNKVYDYVIAGAGCAGLSLLMRLLKEPTLAGKKILLIDKEEKKENDRTWCFWEEGHGFFESIVLKKWECLDFFSSSWNSALAIDPYRYKMIRGMDFYKYCFEEASKHSNVEIRYGLVSGLENVKETGQLMINGSSIYVGDATIFSSIYTPVADKKIIKLLQHFKGWIIETEVDCFEADKATLMDFRISQQHGTSFVYVLPISSRRALVEYTLFTSALLEQEEYELELKSYISDYLKISKYRVVEQEFGIIPMTNEKFEFNRNGVYHLGTAGGQTKASSGYTFQFIQKNSALIVDQIIKGLPIDKIHLTPRRFRFYDHVLLDVLYNKTLTGTKIFTSLFRRNRADSVLRFLDNDTSFLDELKIISSLPAFPFLKAAFRQL